jgi:hypothetical protein
VADNFSVAVINESYQIVSVGLLFTAFEAESFFDWILGSLEHRLSGILRMNVTDEDSAFVCSMAKVHLNLPEIGHRLCVFHKRRNSQKKLDTVPKAPKVCAEAICLFQKIVYGRRSDGIDEAIVQIKQLLSRLDHSIAAEIAGCLAYGSEAYRDQVFTLGIKHTGAAESAEKMLKSSPR